jgi:hypothetical protein
VTFPEALVMLFAIGPAVIAVVLSVQARRQRRRYLAALEAEREETRRAYSLGEDIAERRHSFSAWPWRHR